MISIRGHARAFLALPFFGRLADDAFEAERIDRLAALPEGNNFSYFKQDILAFGDLEALAKHHPVCHRIVFNRAASAEFHSAVKQVTEGKVRITGVRESVTFFDGDCGVVSVFLFLSFDPRATVDDLCADLKKIHGRICGLVSPPLQALRSIAWVNTFFETQSRARWDDVFDVHWSYSLSLMMTTAATEGVKGTRMLSASDFGALTTALCGATPNPLVRANRGRDDAPLVYHGYTGTGLILADSSERGAATVMTTLLQYNMSRLMQTCDLLEDFIGKDGGENSNGSLPARLESTYRMIRFAQKLVYDVLPATVCSTRIDGLVYGYGYAHLELNAQAASLEKLHAAVSTTARNLEERRREQSVNRQNLLLALIALIGSGPLFSPLVEGARDLIVERFGVTLPAFAFYVILAAGITGALALFWKRIS